jgi:nicotinamide-nucleotide amidase
MAEPATDELVAEIHRLLGERGATVAVAESLTGGLLGGALTSVAGSSQTFRGGVIAYATELKGGLLDVDRDLLARFGAVHPNVAVAMAQGVRSRLDSAYGLAVTGVAGPDPQDGQPPGTVHLAVSGPDGDRVESRSLAGARDRVRQQTVREALALLRAILDEPRARNGKDPA